MYHCLRTTYADYKELTVPIALKPLYDQIGAILRTDWNPLGLDNPDEAVKAYNDPVRSLFQLKVRRANGEAIARELYKAETQSMGLFGNMNQCAHVAKRIEEI